MHVHTQEGVGVLPTGYGAPSGDDDDAAAEMDARAPMMRTPPVHHGVSTSGRDLSVIQGFPPQNTSYNTRAFVGYSGAGIQCHGPPLYLLS